MMSIEETPRQRAADFLALTMMVSNQW